MKIAVVEDNAVECADVCNYINHYCDSNCYAVDITTFQNGEALLDAIDSSRFDAFFLDIYLPGMSGMEVARKIRERDSSSTIIFITVSTGHALEGYGVQALSYVTKPLDRERVDKAMHMCRGQLEKNSRTIKVSVGGETVAILLPQIEYIEVFDKATHFHLAQGTVQARMPLDAVEQSLGGLPFLRCHRSFIVNMNRIRDLRENELLMKSGAVVPIRKNGRREIRLGLAKFLSGGTTGES